jgi:DNA (cytosine-5)-methyltransferase 1
MTGPTVGSLFTGYGGLDLAVQAAIGGRHAWVSDIDPGACKIIAHHWPDVPNLGDITAVDWSGVEPVDVLTGGFPCQDVSHAGRRAGLTAGTRSGLWSVMAGAIDKLRPRLVVAENVRGLLSADGGGDVEPCPWCLGDAGDGEPAVRALGTVLADLADLGYDAVWCGLRAADLGAPHSRYRVFIVAWPAEDTDRAAGGEWGKSASGQAAGGRAWSDSRGRGGAPADGVTALLPTPTATPYGNNQSPSAGAAVRPSLDSLASSGALLPTPSVADGMGGHATRSGARSHELLLPGVAKALSESARLLPTPTTRDTKGHNQRRDDTCLTGALLGTPRVSTGGMQGALPVHPAVGTARLEDQIADLLPTPRATDGANGGPNQRGSSGDLMLPSAVQPERWGRYAHSVARWESVLGRPAPAPTGTSDRGGQRLSPAFVEWMMGLPAGWVTDVPAEPLRTDGDLAVTTAEVRTALTRNEQLKALGNGVVPQQAVAGLSYLLGFVPASVWQVAA